MQYVPALGAAEHIPSVFQLLAHVVCVQVVPSGDVVIDPYFPCSLTRPEWLPGDSQLARRDRGIVRLPRHLAQTQSDTRGRYRGTGSDVTEPEVTSWNRK